LYICKKTIDAMEKETWKPVVGYEGLYEVSDWGRVKSLNYRNTGKEGFLKPAPAKSGGYPQVILCKNGKREPCKVHQLVMEAFVGKCPAGYEVDHFDWNPSNNRLDNLSYQPKEANRARHSPEWYKNTAEANRRKAQDPEWKKNHAEGCRKCSQDPEWQKNHAEAMNKLYQDPEWQKKTAEAIRKRCCKPVEQYTLDGVLVKTWSSASEAARELGISNGNISTCCNGKRENAGGFIWKLKEAV